MSNQKAKMAGHIIYWFVVVMWAILIPFFLYNQVEETKRITMIQDIEQRPTSDWFEYISITPTKDSFALWENIYFRSTRIVKEEIPYITLDDIQFRFNEILMCDYGKWEHQRVDPASFTKWVRVKWAWLKVSPQRKWIWWVPYYIPAECYLESNICIDVQWVEKCQFMESNHFKVN